MKMKMKGSEKYAAGSCNRSHRPCRKSDSDSHTEVKEEVEVSEINDRDNMETIDYNIRLLKGSFICERSI